MTETSQISQTPNQNSKKKLITKKKKVNDENHPIDIYKDIKDIDKTLLRLDLGRKLKDFESDHKQRGYNKSYSGNSNWLKSMQQQKRQILEEVSNFLGYKKNEQC